MQLLYSKSLKRSHYIIAKFSFPIITDTVNQHLSAAKAPILVTWCMLYLCAIRYTDIVQIPPHPVGTFTLRGFTRSFFKCCSWKMDDRDAFHGGICFDRLARHIPNHPMRPRTMMLHAAITMINDRRSTRQKQPTSHPGLGRPCAPWCTHCPTVRPPLYVACEQEHIVSRISVPKIPPTRRLGSRTKRLEVSAGQTPKDGADKRGEEWGRWCFYF